MTRAISLLGLTVVGMICPPTLPGAGVFPNNPFTAASLTTVSNTGAHQQSDMGTGYSGVVTSATVRIGFPGMISPGYNLRFVVCHNADATIPWNCSYYSQTNQTPTIIDGEATVSIIQDTADHDYMFTFSSPITLNPAYNYEFAYCEKNISASPTEGCDFPGVPFDLFRSYFTAAQSCPWPFAGSCFEVAWSSAPSCYPPHTIFSDNTGAFGLADATVSNQQLKQGKLTATVMLANRLRIWLGLKSFTPSGIPVPTLAPDLDAGVSGLTARAGLLPPCQSNLNPFTSCKEPGISTWTVGFCAAGDIATSFTFNAPSAILTLADGLLPGSPPSTLITVATALQSVPDLQQAGECLSNGDIQCAKRAILDLARNQAQREETIQILKNSGIAQAEGDVVGKLLVGLFQIEADLITLEIQTKFRNEISLDIVGH